MVGDNSLHLTPAQRRHQAVMRAIVLRLQQTPYVPKGGTALLLTRNLPRLCQPFCVIPQNILLLMIYKTPENAHPREGTRALNTP